jgi:methionyl aminopeptidase
MHEAPEVPNYGRRGNGIQLRQGMCIAIEPMINAGTRFVSTDSNGWTVRTKDGKLSAHFEHTIAITDNGPIILTDPD